MPYLTYNNFFFSEKIKCIFAAFFSFLRRWSVFLQQFLLFWEDEVYFCYNLFFFCNNSIPWPGAASGEKLQVSSFEKSRPLSGHCLPDVLVAKSAIVSWLSINPLNVPLVPLKINFACFWKKHPISFQEFSSWSSRYLQSTKFERRSCELKRTME